MSGSRRLSLDVDAAEGLAAAGLAFLAEDTTRLSHFLTSTGLAPRHLRTEAGSRAVLTAVLEHLMGDESLLLVFAVNKGIEPQTVAQALAVLQEPHLGD
jgi:Protein of unknown function (DUF3572)